jgi:hypothetical protein
MFGGGLAQCSSTTPLLVQIFVHAGRLTSVRAIQNKRLQVYENKLLVSDQQLQLPTTTLKINFLTKGY